VVTRSCKSKDKTSSFTIGTIHSIHYFHNVFLSMVARYILLQGCHTQKNHQILLQYICVQDCYNTFVFKIATIHLCSRLLQYICVQDYYNTFVFKIATIHLCSRLLQYICVQDCYNTFVFKIATIHLCSRLLQYICVQDCYQTLMQRLSKSISIQDC
jgi:hypothetical protein